MTRHELVLPQLGLDDQPMKTGLWLVEPGGRVAAGDPVLEVVVGSAVIDLAAPASGVLAETLVDEDAPLQTGQRLAVIEERAPRDD
jgi:pyruvate/2-oxoglutarate dehydrogenase complex dihydrolipoamide acyltransferase (E2) component